MVRRTVVVAVLLLTVVFFTNGCISILGIDPKTLQESPTVFAYPKKGQNESQVREDDQACSQWAEERTGYRESQNKWRGKIQEGAGLTQKRREYQSAYAACMSPRGYEVR